MPMTHHVSSQLTSQDIYNSTVTVIDHTMTQDGHIGVALDIDGLNTGTGITSPFFVVVNLYQGMEQCLAYSDTINEWSSFAAREWLQLTQTFFVLSGMRVEVTLHSFNSQDTSVDVKGYLYDPNCASDLVSAAKVSVGTDAGQLDVSNGRVKVDDVYHADINVAIDNLDSQDEYTITWFKNGVRVTGTVSTPTIQVVKRDGTNLIGEIAADPGAVGSGVVVHDEDSARLEPGEAVVVIVSASIDSATRTFSKVISRDADA